MDYVFHVLVFVCIYGTLAVSLNAVVGVTGMLSIVHAALWGVGAYTSALLSIHVQLPFVLSLPAAAAASALVAAAIALPALRLNDDYFAMATFGFQMIVYYVLNGWIAVTRGPMGLPGIPRANMFGYEIATPGSFLVLAATVFALSLMAFSVALRSAFGRTLRGIREDEVFVESLGKNVMQHKFLAFVGAAAFAGLAGGLYAHYVTFIDPSSFTVLESILVISMVIVGGSGTLWGPVLGAMVLVIVPELLRFSGLPAGAAANLRQMIYGGLLVLFMMVRPYGLLGRRRN